jgi:hypothetical protein
MFLFIFIIIIFKNDILLNKIKIFKELYFSYKYLSNKNDQSSLFRLIEFNDIKYFLNHYFFFGVGSLSTMTTKIYVSSYLYPSDLGFLGLLFNFGFFGLIIYLYQYVIFYRIYVDKLYLNN